MPFSENLYFLRKREGISQEELAEQLGVSRQAVSKWEIGDTYPETEKIIMLCDRYGVTMDALMRGDVRTENQTQSSAEEQAAPQSEPLIAAYPPANEQDDDEKEGTLAQKIAQAVTWLCAVLVYLVLGVFGDLWHPGWILFVYMPAVSAVVDLIAAPKAEKRGKIAGTIDIVVIMCSVGTYLLCGFFLGMWGTMWVIFFAIPITCIITGVFSSKNKK